MFRQKEQEIRHKRTRSSCTNTAMFRKNIKPTTGQRFSTPKIVKLVFPLKARDQLKLKSFFTLSLGKRAKDKKYDQVSGPNRDNISAKISAKKFEFWGKPKLKTKTLIATEIYQYEVKHSRKNPNPQILP